MLEIILLGWLCGKNRENALARKRNPIFFVILTIVLWFGLEFTGLAIGFEMDMDYGAYGLGLGGAAIGAVISFLVAKFGPVGKYVLPAIRIENQFTEKYVPLSQPCEVKITGEGKATGALANYSYYLNKNSLGNLSSGQSATVQTDQKQNVLLLKDANGNYSKPLLFEVSDGGSVDIHMAFAKFLPAKSTGIVKYGKAVMLDEEHAIKRVKYCENCGAENDMASLFCCKCNEKL